MLIASMATSNKRHGQDDADEDDHFSVATQSFSTTRPSHVDNNGNELNFFQRTFTCKRVLKWLGLAAYITTGFVFYWYYEHWDPFQTLYFTVVTSATVGYGYDYPTSDSSRLFTIFYAIIGVYVVFFYIGKEISKSFSAGMKYIKKLPLGEEGKVIDQQKKLALVFIAIMIIFILVSGGIFVAMEPNWSYIEGVYFAVQTTTTIGYGDLSKPDRTTKVFLIFYIIFSTLLSAFIYNTIQLLHAEVKQLRRLQAKLQRQQNLDFLAEMDQGDGVREAEFVLAILEHNGTLNKERDVDPWKKKFQEMQPDRDRLYKESLLDFSCRESVFAKEAITVVGGNIEAASIFDPITSMYVGEEGTAAAAGGQPKRYANGEVQLQSLQNPMH